MKIQPGDDNAVSFDQYLMNLAARVARGGGDEAELEMWRRRHPGRIEALTKGQAS